MRTDDDHSRDGTGATSIDVRFDCGQDVLNSYWGYLANGGLVIDNDATLEIGHPVDLNVVIASAGARYRLAGTLVKRHDDGSRMVVAFRPDQPHDMLLTAALAETENAPTRQYSRYRVEFEARADGRPVRVVNVSRGGLGLSFGGDILGQKGDRVEVECEGRSFAGCITWVSCREAGIQFDDPNTYEGQVLELVEEFLVTIVR